MDWLICRLLEWIPTRVRGKAIAYPLKSTDESRGSISVIWRGTRNYVEFKKEYVGVAVKRQKSIMRGQISDSEDRK